MTCAYTAEAPLRDPAMSSPRNVGTVACGTLSVEEVELRTQLQDAREELAAMDAMESRALMCFEDELASCRQLLETRDREIDTLERQLIDAEYGGRFGHEPGNPVGDVTRELEAVEIETRVLASDVQLWERTVAGLKLDLRNSLEYFFASNMDVADLSRGPSRCIRSKGFLPNDLCAKLDLSNHCIPYISNLMEEQRPFMPRRSSGSSETTIMSGHSGHHSSRHTSKSKRHNSKERMQQYRLLGPGLDSPPTVGLLGAGLEVINSPFSPRKLSVGSTKPSTGFRTSSSESVEDIKFEKFQRKISVDLLEEGRLLQEGLAAELQQLDTLLVPPAAGTGLEARLPIRDLLRAAAHGDVSAVKVWLPCVESTCGGQHDKFLGWTAWHVAAAYGQCGVIWCLKEELLESATHYIAALDQPTSVLGLPPLGIACIRGQVEAVRSLLLCMAPVSSCDVRGNTPLLWAAVSDRAHILVPLLLEARADPNVANASGQRIDPWAYSRPQGVWPLEASETPPEMADWLQAITDLMVDPVEPGVDPVDSWPDGGSLVSNAVHSHEMLPTQLDKLPNSQTHVSPSDQLFGREGIMTKISPRSRSPELFTPPGTPDTQQQFSGQLVQTLYGSPRVTSNAATPRFTPPHRHDHTQLPLAQMWSGPDNLVGRSPQTQMARDASPPQLSGAATHGHGHKNSMNSQGLVLGKGSWANAYRQATGVRRDALALLCTSGIVTARELADDLTVISEEHIEECVGIASEMLLGWPNGLSSREETQAIFEEKLAALYVQNSLHCM